MHRWLTQDVAGVISSSLAGVSICRAQIQHAGEGGLYAELIQDRSFSAVAYTQVLFLQAIPCHQPYLLTRPPCLWKQQQHTSACGTCPHALHIPLKSPFRKQLAVLYKGLGAKSCTNRPAGSTAWTPCFHFLQQDATHLRCVPILQGFLLNNANELVLGQGAFEPADRLLAYEKEAVGQGPSRLGSKATLLQHQANQRYSYFLNVPQLRRPTFECKSAKI